MCAVIITPTALTCTVNASSLTSLSSLNVPLTTLRAETSTILGLTVDQTITLSRLECSAMKIAWSTLEKMSLCRRCLDSNTVMKTYSSSRRNAYLATVPLITKKVLPSKPTDATETTLQLLKLTKMALLPSAVLFMKEALSATCTLTTSTASRST